MKKLPSNVKAAISISVVLLLLLLASLAWILWSGSRNAEDAMVADIYQDDVLIKSIDLSKVVRTERFTISGAHGEENVIEVRPGEIAVISANCPEQVCVHQGFRSNGLLPITCLPNHLMIMIRPADPNAPRELDAITY
jgi:hypothetical protein